MDYVNTIKVLNEFADTLINEYKDKLGSEGWQSGKLYNSIKKVSVKNSKGNFKLTLNLEEYWKYIEYGRKAGAKMPPIISIKNWIVRKNIIPRPITLKNGKKVLPNINSLAFLISRSISKKGIKAKPFFKTSLQTAKDMFIDKIKDALVQDLINNGFNDSK